MCRHQDRSRNPIGREMYRPRTDYRCQHQSSGQQDELETAHSRMTRAEHGAQKATGNGRQQTTGRTAKITYHRRQGETKTNRGGRHDHMGVPQTTLDKDSQRWNSRNALDADRRRRERRRTGDRDSHRSRMHQGGRSHASGAVEKDMRSRIAETPLIAQYVAGWDTAPMSMEPRGVESAGTNTLGAWRNVESVHTVRSGHTGGGAETTDASAAPFQLKREGEAAQNLGAAKRRTATRSGRCNPQTNLIALIASCEGCSNDIIPDDNINRHIYRN